MEERQHSSPLFTLRLWREELGNGEAEWRGKVQHVASGEVQHVYSGEVRYFRQWMTLIDFLRVVLVDKESDAHDVH